MTDIPLISLSSERMNEDPVHYLLEQRSVHGDIFYLKQGPIFCRDDGCVGSVAVLSVTGARFILENYGIFKKPDSAIILSSGHTHVGHKLFNPLMTIAADQHRQIKQYYSQIIKSHQALFEQHINIATKQYLSSLDSLTTHNVHTVLEDINCLCASLILFGNDSEENMSVVRLMLRLFKARDKKSATLEERAANQVLIDHISFELYEKLINKIHRLSPGEYEKTLLHDLVFNPHSLERSALHKDVVVGFIVHSCFALIQETIAATVNVIVLMCLHPQYFQQLSNQTGVQMLSQIDNIIHESMRLLPPNAMLTRYNTQAVDIDGHVFPKHTEFLLCPLVMYRINRCKPHSFYPERWDTEEEKRRFHFPFGWGRTMCPAKQLGVNQTKTILHEMLSRFRFYMPTGAEITWAIRGSVILNTDVTMVLSESGIPDVTSDFVYSDSASTLHHLVNVT